MRLDLVSQGGKKVVSWCRSPPSIFHHWWYQKLSFLYLICSWNLNFSASVNPPSFQGMAKGSALLEDGVVRIGRRSQYHFKKWTRIIQKVVAQISPFSPLIALTTEKGSTSTSGFFGFTASRAGAGVDRSEKVYNDNDRLERKLEERNWLQ
jgi:hypothetical protein